MTHVHATFRAWVDEVGGTGAVARLLRVSAPTISLIYHGRRTPGIRLAAKIERLAGTCKSLIQEIPRISASAWAPEE